MIPRRRSGGLLPLRRTEDGGDSPLATSVRLRRDSRRILATFRCEARELTPLGERHDDDLFAGDVVELFVAPDAADRRTYYELELSPSGLRFDARVASPSLSREGMSVDRTWDPPSFHGGVRLLRNGTGRIHGWLARMAVSFRDLGIGSPETTTLAVGAFRIDRRSASGPAFLALSPTLRTPADFHVPERFLPWRADSREFAIPSAA